MRQETYATVLMCLMIWHHYNDAFISSDLIGQKFLIKKLTVISGSPHAFFHLDITARHIFYTDYC